MSPWDTAARWVNAILLVVVGCIGFDTLFRLLEANEENVIVGFTRSVTAFFLAPFQGMFDDQEFLLTALIAVLGYALLAGIALAVIRAVQASIRRRVAAQREHGVAGGPPIGGPPSPAMRRAAYRPQSARTGGGQDRTEPTQVDQGTQNAAASESADGNATEELGGEEPPAR